MTKSNPSSKSKFRTLCTSLALATLLFCVPTTLFIYGGNVFAPSTAQAAPTIGTLLNGSSSGGGNQPQCLKVDTTTGASTVITCPCPSSLSNTQTCAPCSDLDPSLCVNSPGTGSSSGGNNSNSDADACANLTLADATNCGLTNDKKGTGVFCGQDKTGPGGDGKSDNCGMGGNIGTLYKCSCPNGIGAGKCTTSVVQVCNPNPCQVVMGAGNPDACGAAGNGSGGGNGSSSGGGNGSSSGGGAPKYTGHCDYDQDARGVYHCVCTVPSGMSCTALGGIIPTNDPSRDGQCELAGSNCDCANPSKKICNTSGSSSGSSSSGGGNQSKCLTTDTTTGATTIGACPCPSSLPNTKSCAPCSDLDPSLCTNSPGGAPDGDTCHATITNQSGSASVAGQCSGNNNCINSPDTISVETTGDSSCANGFCCHGAPFSDCWYGQFGGPASDCRCKNNYSGCAPTFGAGGWSCPPSDCP